MRARGRGCRRWIRQAGRQEEESKIKGLFMHAVNDDTRVMG